MVQNSIKKRVVNLSGLSMPKHLLLPLIALATPLFADPTIPKNFFQFKSEWTHFSSSNIYKPHIVGNHISADVISGNIYLNHLFNKRSGFRIGTGYDGLKLDWDNNPLTSQKLFSLAEVYAGLFLMGIENWDIYGEASVALSTKHTNWSTYALYRGILYTKYNFQDKFNLHAGFTGYYGMRYNKVVPIIGVDFKLGRYFQVHGVFPHDLGVEYMPTSYLSAFVRARIIDTPRRLAPDAIRPRGAIVYHNLGAEFALKAHFKQYFGATGYIGRTLHGYVKAEDRDGGDLAYYRFRNSLYAGFSAFITF